MGELAEKQSQISDLKSQIGEEGIRAEIADKKRVENARAWFQKLVQEEGLEYIAAARRLGLNDNARSPVSAFCRDKFTGDPTNLVLAIEALRAQLEGPEGITDYIGFRETRCARLLLRHAQAARDGHYIGLLVGGVGYGKTEAIREAERRSRDDGKPPMLHIYSRISTHLPALICEVAESLGLIPRGGGGDPARLHRQVAQSLLARPRFLIFDEADYLNERCLTFIRNLHDESGIGALVVGRPALVKTIERGMQWSTTNGDSRDHATMDGPLAPFVDRVFAAALPGLGDDEVIEITEGALKARLDQEAIQKLLFYVGPNFRLLSRMIGKLRDIRLKAGRTIDKKMIEAAWLKFQGGLFSR